MKQIQDFRVVSNTDVRARMFRLTLTPADGKPLAECRPGQFVEVRVDGNPSVFLRRPISIHRIDRERNELQLLIQVAGRGTETLSHLEPGSMLNIVYPLGNGFTMPEAGLTERHLLVGGGVGIAPLLELGRQLKAQGQTVTYLLGVRTYDEAMAQWLKPYAETATLLLTTEDGSAGERGFATQHSQFRTELYDHVHVCGPMPMMKAVARGIREQLAALQHVAPEEAVVPRGYCEVSLENKMACGLGVCLCCVEDTRDGHRCVCSDGPVFDIIDLKSY